MAVHGYSMLRTSLNMDYYHDLYDLATDFGVEVEAHRKLQVSASSVYLSASVSHRFCPLLPRLRRRLFRSRLRAHC